MVFQSFTLLPLTLVTRYRIDKNTLLAYLIKKNEERIE